MHKRLGKPSCKRIDEDINQKCIQVYKEKYYDFTSTLASEKLDECDGINTPWDT